MQEQVRSFETQLESEGIHFLFPSGELVSKDSDLPFPSKEYQNRNKEGKVRQ